MDLKSYGSTRVLKVEPSTDAKELAQKLNEIKHEGYEIVATVGNFIIFKEKE